jgi:hypothetical protein
MAENTGFSIARRAVGDPELHDHEPYPINSVEYTCIATPLSIALLILEQEYSKEVLTHLALLFDNVASNSASFAKDEATARRWTSWFVDQLRANPPTMVVDGNLGRIMLDVMGYHPRTVWNGSLDQFSFRGQSVHLNAEVGAHRLSDTLLDTPRFVLTIHEESEVDDCCQKKHVF